MYGSTPVPDHVHGGDQVGSGVPCLGFASQQQGYILHTHHIVLEVVFVSEPAIVRGPSNLLGVPPPGLNESL